MESKTKNLQKIHPLNRDRVRNISDYLSQDPNVRKVIIFGSSVTARCHNDSDVDIYIELKDGIDDERSPLHGFYHDYPCDVWTNYSVDERLKKEILTTGVTVYD